MKISYIMLSAFLMVGISQAMENDDAVITENKDIHPYDSGRIISYTSATKTMVTYVQLKEGDELSFAGYEYGIWGKGPKVYFHNNASTAQLWSQLRDRYYGKDR